MQEETLRPTRNFSYLFTAMARPSRSTHPLAKLRKCISKTQREFALIAGVSHITIGRIEAGSLAMSPALAQRISAATGVDPDSISDPTSKTPLVLGRASPYSDSAFLYWTASLQNDPAGDDTRIMQHGEVLKVLMEELLFASAAGKRKFRPVLVALCQKISEVREEFGLSMEVAKIRRGQSGPKDPKAYERRNEHCFLLTSLNRTGSGVKASKRIAVPDDWGTFDPADYPAYQEQAALEVQTELQQEVMRLSS